MKPAKLTGVIHLPALPGSPKNALLMSEILERTVLDAQALADAGFDLAMIENFGDAPFFAGSVPAVTIAAMTACAFAIREALPNLPLGVNVLRNDVASAIAIAHVVDARAVRVNVLSGARVTDQGIIEGRAADTLRLRKDLGADGVEIWADVDVKHSAPLAPRPVAEEAAELHERALADALLVTGKGTGAPIAASDLAKAREGAPAARIYVASGSRIEDLKSIAERANGVVVGSALRTSGRAGDPIDLDIAKKFADAFRSAFEL
ncbi:MAG: BtpA/SgcQ family protein [Polyangiaceae bacterium]